jgi:amidohydrolase
MAVDPKTAAHERIERAREQLLDLSHRIHAHPELAMEEERACAWLCEAMSEAGFAVERGVGGLPTAFAARRGPGPLRLVVCAEYDALPAIGHACGHNVIAAMAAGAGIGLGAVADDVGLEVTVLGTPAEESVGGKIILLDKGAFAGAHAAMMVHPHPLDVVELPVIAVDELEVRYLGREAHAAAFPELGVNAADAMVVAQTAIGLLRQHLRPTDRVHGIVTKGGDAPNVVPARTEGTWLVRAHDLGELEEVEAKVRRCFEAGALATGAELELTLAHPPYAEMHHDPGLAAAYRRNAEALGRRFVDAESLQRVAGSTDMGNVSLALPSIHPSIAVDCLPAVNHQPEFTAHCVTPAADKAVLDGAVAMAWTAIDAATDDRLRQRLMRGVRGLPSEARAQAQGRQAKPSVAPRWIQGPGGFAGPGGQGSQGGELTA